MQSVFQTSPRWLFTAASRPQGWEERKSERERETKSKVEEKTYHHSHLRKTWSDRGEKGGGGWRSSSQIVLRSLISQIVLATVDSYDGSSVRLCTLRKEVLLLRSDEALEAGGGHLSFFRASEKARGRCHLSFYAKSDRLG